MGGTAPGPHRSDEKESLEQAQGDGGEAGLQRQKPCPEEPASPAKHAESRFPKASQRPGVGQAQLSRAGSSGVKVSPVHP